MMDEDRQTVTQREAFEAWLDFDEDQMQMLAGRDESGDYLHATIAIQWEAWQAATAAERERCAKVCERERMVRGGEVFAADIRRGT